MSLKRAFSVVAIFAALCIAMSSVASAARMAPSPSDHVAMQAYVLTGGSMAELCTSDDIAHDEHHCPFCRLLADLDDLTPVISAWQLIPPSDHARLADLTRADQRPGLGVCARGPPAAA